MPVIDYSPPDGYFVQMLIVVGTDTAIPGGSVASYLAATDASIVASRQWYYDNLDGYTFKALPSKAINPLGLTELQICQLAGRSLTSTWIAIMNAADAAGLITKSSPKRLYAVNSPINIPGQGGSLGMESLGGPHVFPGWQIGEGKMGRLFAGVYSGTSVATPPSPATSGNTLAVTAGMGISRLYAMPWAVPAFVDQSVTVSTPPSPATSGTTLTLSAVTDLPPVPFYASVWPASAAEPTSGDEIVLVTGMSGNTVTAMTRAQFSTSARTVVAGDRFSAGFLARVWAAPPAHPTAGGFEFVRVVRRLADSLIVNRAQNGTSARTIVAGDQIRVDDEEWWAAEPDNARGGFTHECGHGFGGMQWNPRESWARPADWTEGGSEFGQRNGLSVRGMTPHPADVYTNYESNGITSIMQAWWEFPDATFLATEKSRLLGVSGPGGRVSPFLTHHDTRPTGLSDGGGGGPPPPSYAIQPLAWWASDTATDTTIWTEDGEDHPVPFDPSTFTANIDANVLEVRRWFYDKFDGYTFTALPAVMYTSPSTRDALASSMPGIAHFHDGMRAADLALSGIDFTATNRLHYMVTPLNNIAASFGSALGRAENFTSFVPPYGAQGELPCACVQWGYGSARSAGRDLGAYPASDNGTLPGLARGTFAHELGHVLGYSLSNPDSHLYPHDASSPPGGGQNLMHPNMTVLTSLNPSADAKTKFKLSPFMTFHATRP